MQNLGKTKKKINFLFVVIIFMLFLSIGIGFFVFKFFYGEKTQIEDLKKIRLNTIKDENYLSQNLEGEEEYLKKIETENINDSVEKNIENYKKQKNLDNFLENFEKEIFKEIEAQEKKTSSFPQVSKKMKSHYKIFSKKYIVFDIDSKRILFSNLDDLKKFDFKKIAGITDEIKKLNNYFVFQVKLKGEDNIPKYQILFLEKQKFLFSELKKDLYLYLFFAIIFLFILYFFIKKIVDYIFKPVEKNISEMEDFTHHAGHELKNPLAGIKSSVELLKEFGEYKPKLVNQTLGEIKKINSLIDTLKNFSFLEQEKILEEIDVSLELKNILKKYYKQIKEKKITINFLEKNNFKLKIPKNHFYILFSNLISNAIKYTNKNPKIEIIIDKNFVIIKDNGIGIKKENLQKIFHKFFREKNHRDNNGFGLGLSLVEKIIKKNNWKIDFESKENKGTTVKVEF